MVECQLPKLNTRVRFPSPAPLTVKKPLIYIMRLSYFETVSLPQWLYELASEKGISLSKTLQKALKDELGIN